MYASLFGAGHGVHGHGGQAAAGRRGSGRDRKPDRVGPGGCGRLGRPRTADPGHEPGRDGRGSGCWSSRETTQQHCSCRWASPSRTLPWRRTW
ncbi:hypothetical protein QJS66_15715 [Kocuria rhizophila]|nr:hypothetical protein QJS66_15715 [Kocuria rhizophila]